MHNDGGTSYSSHRAEPSQVGLLWELPLEVESLPISVSVTTFQAHVIMLQEFQSWKSNSYYNLSRGSRNSAVPLPLL